MRVWLLLGVEDMVDVKHCTGQKNDEYNNKKFARQCLNLTYPMSSALRSRDCKHGVF